MREDQDASTFLTAVKGVRLEMLADVRRRAATRQAGRLPGPITGYEPLDRMLGGGLNPGLHVLHGLPGAGKTALALGIAAQCEAPALFVSCEVRPKVLYRRLMASICTIRMSDIFQSSEAELIPLMDRTDKTCSSLGFMDGTQAEIKVDDMKYALDVLKTSCGPSSRADGALVVVDSLHTWAMRSFPELEERARIDQAITFLEVLAQTQEVAVLMICERNRSNREESGQTAPKGSSRIEYCGETMMGMDEKPRKKDDPEPDPRDPKEFILHVSKNREGGTGKLSLTFDGAYQKHHVSAIRKSVF